MDTRYFNRIAAVYGLGVDEFLDLFARQNHACAVCKTPLVLFSSVKREKPVVDHCHLTGKVRGILCYGCNVAIGWIEKDAARTARCAKYIQATSDRAVYRANLHLAQSANNVVAIQDAKAALQKSLEISPAQSLALITEFERATLASREGAVCPLGKSDAYDAGPQLVHSEEVIKAG